MPKALITGGAGFIGSHLCSALVNRGWHVTCIDNLSTGSYRSIKGLPNINFIKANVNKWSTFRGLGHTNFDAVFHYAATVGVRLTEENPHLVLEDIMGLRNIDRFARGGHAGRVIFSSSSEVYGNSPAQPVREDSGNSAWSPYTAVKIFGEHLLRALSEDTGIPSISLRFFNVYGSGQRGNGYGFVVGKFLRQALKGQPLTVYGDGEQTRDYVYIEDNIKSTLDALGLAGASGQAVNIGTGKETTVLELAKTIARVTGKPHLSIERLPGRATEIRRRCADTTLQIKLLGSKCSTPLENGLSRVLAEKETRLTPSRATLALSQSQ